MAPSLFLSTMYRYRPHGLQITCVTPEPPTCKSASVPLTPKTPMQSPWPLESYRPTCLLNVPAARIPDCSSIASAERIPVMLIPESLKLEPFFLPVLNASTGPSPGRERSKMDKRLSEPARKREPSAVKSKACGEMKASVVGLI